MKKSCYVTVCYATYAKSTSEKYPKIAIIFFRGIERRHTLVRIDFVPRKLTRMYCNLAFLTVFRYNSPGCRTRDFNDTQNLE